MLLCCPERHPHDGGYGHQHDEAEAEDQRHGDGRTPAAPRRPRGRRRGVPLRAACNLPRHRGITLSYPADGYPAAGYPADGYSVMIFSRWPGVSVAVSVKPFSTRKRFRFSSAKGMRAAIFAGVRSEEHTSELKSPMRIQYAGFC